MPYAHDAAVAGETSVSAGGNSGLSADAVQKETAKSRAVSPRKRECNGPVLDAFQVARFWSRVEVGNRQECWPWRRGVNSDGYAEFKYKTNRYLAHRIAFRIARGELPFKAVIRHKCDNPRCVNPWHLEVGTHADNVADRVARGRSAIGEQNGRAKLTEKVVKAILDSPLSVEYWANRCEVDPSTIRAIRLGKNWRHLQ